MKIINMIILGVFITFNSCQAQDKEEKKESINSKIMINKPFDLSNLTLNEDIFDVLNASGLKLEDNQKTDAFTLMGYQKFESTSPKLLNFHGNDLSSKNADGTNNIILYYAEEDNLANAKEYSLGMYQVNLFTINEIDLLKNELNIKFGKSKFNHNYSGNAADIKNNELIQTDTKLILDINIWDNNNIIYYSAYQKTDNLETFNLFVFKKKNRQFVGFISALGYFYISEALK